jgi:hypothetical protein
MKFQIKILYIILFTGIGINTAYPQYNTISGGSTGSGSLGNSSFTIGQVFHVTLTNKIANNSKVIRQALKVSAFKNENLSDILLDVTVFPNPTSANVVVKITNVPFDEFDFLLYDLSGRMIMKQKVKSNETVILMDKLVGGMYVLKVNRNNRELQTFKIIKNQ